MTFNSTWPMIGLTFILAASTALPVGGVARADLSPSNFPAAGHRTTWSGFKTIDFPGAQMTECTSMNDHGDIVGFYGGPHKGDEGFLYKSSRFTTLDATGAGRDTYPQSINDRGDIVGGYLVPVTFNKRGFLLHRGKYKFLGGYAGVWENGIDSRGDIAGVYSRLGRSPVSAKKPMTWGVVIAATGKTSAIRVPGEGLGGCFIWGLNDHGDVAGSYVPSTANPAADHPLWPSWMSNSIAGFARIGGRFVTISGPPGSLESECEGVNNAGVVIGRYMDADHLGHAFLWYRGHYRLLRAPHSDETVAQAINNRGQVVGYYTSIFDGRRHGFVYTP